MQIITAKYHYTPNRMAQIPKARTPITGEMQTQELSLITSGNAKWHRKLSDGFIES